MAQDPVADLLKGASTTNAVRASAWDAFHNSPSAEELSQKLALMPLPNETKAALWDLKAQGRASAQAVQAIGPEPTGGVKGFAREFWQRVNPVEIVKSLASAAGDLPGAVQNIGAAQGAVFDKARAAADSGDYVKATRHFLNYLVPLLGPEMDKAADLLHEGRTAEGLGATAGIGANVVGPAAVAKVRNVPVPGLSGTRLNAADQAAVQFAEQRHVPLDAATATGRPIVRIAQKRASDSMGGAGVAEKVIDAQAQALSRVGDEIAGSVAPKPATPVTAGEGVRGALTKKIETLHAEATRAYETLRQLEAKAPSETRAPKPGAPIQSMKFAVDLRTAKEGLKPLQQRLERKKAVVGVLQGGEARAATAIDTLMAAPDFAPLSVVDDALGELKAMARGAEMPELRTGGQAAAALAVKQLDTAVRETALRAGPDVFKALQAGRQATRAKYRTAEVLDMLSAEPRQVFNLLTSRKDAALGRLKAVQAEVPDQIPSIGRAYLEELLERAKAEGKFGHADALFAEWQKLGPNTKSVLFKPETIRELDSYFRLAKKIAENPNPSGTARVMTFFNIGSTLGTYPLAKLLYTPAGVRLLKKGLVVPASDKAAVSAYLGEVAKMAEGSRGLLSPAVADREPGNQRRSAR